MRQPRHPQPPSHRQPLATSPRATLAAAALAAATLAACGTSASATQTTLPTTTTQACTQGAKQGTLDYWSTTDPATFGKEVQPWAKAHPKIKISFTSLRPGDEAERVLAEKQAGRGLDADAISGDILDFEPLFANKMVQNIDWSHFGVPADHVLSIDKVSVPRNYRLAGVIAYNTHQVTASELPSTWQGLVSSRWANKIIVDPRGLYLAPLVLAWGKQQTMTWFKRLMQVDKPVVLEGSTASLQQVDSGQAAISTSATLDNVKQQMASGAPIGYKYLNVIPTTDYYDLVLQGAPHLAAAVCFLSWWDGPAGSAQRLRYAYQANDTTPPGAPPSAKLATITTAGQGTLANDVGAQMAKLMTANS